MSDVKQVAGIWLPATEQHLLPFLTQSAKQSQSGLGSYQLHTLSGFVNHVPADRRGVVIDIGGNVGLWSMHFSRVFDKVVAYEPDPLNQKCFRLNTIDHPVYPTPNVILRPVALGSHEGFIEIESDPEVTSGTHVAPADLAKRLSHATHTRVAMTTIDAEAHPAVDAIKIDVEGYEYPVLLGAEKTIRKFRPIICIEQKPWDIFEWEQYAAAKLLQSWGAKPVQRIVDDFIFAWE
jgi:FkbM family methyltransferase